MKKVVSMVMIIAMFSIIVGGIVGYSGSACATDGVLRDSNGKPVMGCSMGFYTGC